ncbi:MAG TPA: pitrilysin family protein [candidate division Zixibacteria bacterium]|nr:pitrilysin family protein [candidate division Zixibacteria bacterium]
MKKVITTIILTALVAGVMALPLSAQDVNKLKYPPLNPLQIPTVKQITLENGLRLYMVEDKSLPLFNASVRINCGSHLDPADRIGLAEVTGAVLRTGGTKKWSGDEIDEMLEAVGASVETYIGLESGGGSVNVLSEYTDLGLDVLAEILRNPVFEQDKIDLEKVQQRTAISRRNDDPQEIGSREFYKVIYGPNSVYGRHSEYATINSITRDDLVKFHKDYITPDKVQIGVWGDFDEAKLVAKINQLFADWSKGNVIIPAVPAVDYKFINKVFYVEKNDVTQSNIYMGHIGGKVTDDDYAARIVMNNILGGGFGNRMLNAVRSKEGLAYSAGATYTANIAYPGIFYTYVGTKTETTAKAVQEALKVIRGMQTDPPTEEEMSKGKNAYLNSFVFNFDTKGEVVNRMMNYDFYGLPQDFLQKTKEGVEKVTAADVMAAAKKNLRPDALQLVIVGKGKEFDMPLDQLALGAVEAVDITIPSGEQKAELAVTPENLEKGKNVLSQAVSAHGGLASFKKVNSIKSKGTFTVVVPQGEFAIPVDVVRVFPDKIREEAVMMGQKMLSIRNGNSGWRTDQTGTLVPMSEDELMDENKDDLRNTVRIFQQSDGNEYQTVYDGAGEVDGTPVDFVVIMNKAGENVCRMAFNSSTHKLVGKSYWGKSATGEGNIVEKFDKFTQVDGLLLPFKTVRELDGKKCDYTEMTEYMINAQISPDNFAKPSN